MQCATNERPLLYHKLMTPQYLNATANHLVSASRTALHFKVGVTRGRILRVPIFQEGCVPNEDIVVYVKVYLRDPPTGDSDLLVSICDGSACNGLYVSDRGNYPENNACNYASFSSGPIFTNANFLSNCGGSPITYNTYPNEVTLTFYPSEQLGTFHIIPHGGYTTAASFTRKLDLTQGLFLELYGGDVTEEYILQYIHVEVKAN